MVRLVLSSDEIGRLLKPVRGQGGWQSLLRKLQSQIEGNVLVLTQEDVARILRYREKYGSGGWQGRLGFLNRHALKPAA